MWVAIYRIQLFAKEAYLKGNTVFYQAYPRNVTVSLKTTIDAGCVMVTEIVCHIVEAIHSYDAYKEECS